MFNGTRWSRSVHPWAWAWTCMSELSHHQHLNLEHVLQIWSAWAHSMEEPALLGETQKLHSNPVQMLVVLDAPIAKGIRQN
jgi:hypothetical protein